MTIPYQESTNRLPADSMAALHHLVEGCIGDLFTALCIVVLQGGETRLEAAWGQVNPAESDAAVTPDTLFDLASVSKIFTTTAFLAQVSAGKVRLDTPLVEVIPEFGAINPRFLDGGEDPHARTMLPVPAEVVGKTADPGAVTFFHLLTHTSGLAPWRAVFREAGDTPLPPDKADPVPRSVRWQRGLEAICRYPFVGEVGSGIRYSDLGLMLLGEAASRLADQPLDVLVQRQVLDPLALTEVMYNPMQYNRTRSQIVATEYDNLWRQRRVWGEVHDENACGVGGVAGHAGLFGTARQVARLGQAWLSGDPRLGIAAELMNTAHQEQASDALNRRGLGWVLQHATQPLVSDAFGPDSYGHTGFTGTALWIEPAHEAVFAVFSNRVYMGRQAEGYVQVRTQLHSLLMEAL